MDTTLLHNNAREKKAAAATGFTIVEVIVISVIIAALAVTAVMVYSGYVEDARKRVADHTAATAATFLITAVNLGEDVTTYKQELTKDEQWVIQRSTGNGTIYRCPEGVTITINSNKKTVRAKVKNVDSREYKYSQ